MAKSSSVAEKPQQTAVSTEVMDFGQYAGDGLENVQAKDLMIPRLGILQTLSPQVNPKKPEFIEGAKVGQICDLGMGEIIDPPCLFLPVHYNTVWVEWFPRATGKGLAAIHNDDKILQIAKENEKRQMVLPNGNILQDTRQFFGINVSAGWRKTFLPFVSTQIKKAKKWITFATGEKVMRPDGSEFTPPLFYRLYGLTSVEESNSQGDWYGWKIAPGQKLQEVENGRSLFELAAAFRKQIIAGDIKVDLGDAVEEANQQESSNEGPM